jgi:biopolymer transport protein ExbB
MEIRMSAQTGNWFTAGGEVMYPLLGFSILGIALILERLIFWSKVLKRTDRLVRETLNLYRRNPSAAFGLLEKNTDLPISRIFLAALELDRATPEEFRLALESSAQAELPLLKRFSTVFETIISLAPLLGLLGTVLGLIRSFGSLTLSTVGGKNTVEVTGGVSEALISTASGLGVAIVTLLFANSFRGLYLRQLAMIQEYGGQLELLYRRRFDTTGGARYTPTQDPRY